MTKTAQRLSPAMARAMDDLRAGKGYRVSLATAKALHRRGLAVITFGGTERVYGSLGPAGGRNRGYTCTQWTVTLSQ